MYIPPVNTKAWFHPTAALINCNDVGKGCGEWTLEVPPNPFPQLYNCPSAVTTEKRTTIRRTNCWGKINEYQCSMLKTFLCYFLQILSASLFSTWWKLCPHWNFLAAYRKWIILKLQMKIHMPQEGSLLYSPDNAALWSPLAIMLVIVTPSNP